MTAYSIDNHTLVVDDIMRGLSRLPDKSVQMCITSPPYFGLRKYALPQNLIGGAADCAHDIAATKTCRLCGGWAISLGEHEDPREYVWALRCVFDEVKRILRDDGTLWLNLGDSWCGSGRGPTGVNGFGRHTERQGFDSPKVTIPSGWKAKDMFGLPHLIAQALREDGWYLRGEIIWVKPGGGMFSGQDRPSSQHEYVFLFSKKKQYFYDNFAVREKLHEVVYHASMEDDVRTSNLRNVWWINPDATRWKGDYSHTATFPKELVRRCISLATPPFTCPLGDPVERIVIRNAGKHNPEEAARRVAATGGAITGGTKHSTLGVTDDVSYQLRGYTRPCITRGEEHEIGAKQAVVLDPFIGSGTTMQVAQELGRRCIGIDLMPASLDLIQERMPYATIIEEANAATAVESRKNRAAHAIVGDLPS